MPLPVDDRVKKTLEFIRTQVPQGQRQDSLTDQARDLIDVADALGAYDFSDYVRSRFYNKTSSGT